MQIEIYEIMHKEKKVAKVSTSGKVQIFQEQFMIWTGICLVIERKKRRCFS